MTTCFAIFTVFSTCSLLGGPASMQPVAAQAEPAAWVAQAAAPAHRSAPALATTASTDLKTPVATRGTALAASALAAGIAGSVATTVNAAGSVLVLADGIVAGAHMPQVLPPAPGFQYER